MKKSYKCHNNCEFCKKHISERINHFVKELNILAKTRSKKRRSIIFEKAGPCLVRILCECALNTLKGNITLGPKELKRLKKYGKPLVELVKNNKEPYNKARNCLEKTGGFLPVILPAIISAIGGVLGPVITKAIGGKDG